MTDTKEVSKLPEAPVSVTVKVKSKKGFEYLLTMRDESMLSTFEKIEKLEATFEKLGWTALAQGNSGGFPKKQVNYVQGRECPKCGAQLLHAETKDGKKFIKCSTNKWDFAAKRAVGCPFTEWPQSEQSKKTNDAYDAWGGEDGNGE